MFEILGIMAAAILIVVGFLAFRRWKQRRPYNPNDIYPHW